MINLLQLLELFQETEPGFRLFRCEFLDYGSVNVVNQASVGPLTDEDVISISRVLVTNNTNRVFN